MEGVPWKGPKMSARWRKEEMELRTHRPVQAGKHTAEDGGGRAGRGEAEKWNQSQF